LTNQPKEYNHGNGVVEEGLLDWVPDKQSLVTEQGSMSLEYILSEPVELLGSDLYAVSGGVFTGVSNIGSFNLNGSGNGNSNGNGNLAALLGINGNFNGNFNGNINGNILVIEVLVPVNIVL
jgi:hypothetical protein